MNMIIAGIVTFEPDIDRLQENLDAISAQVSRILIYDNGSYNQDDILNLTESYPTIKVIWGVTNDGIAAALNRLAEAALEIGAKQMLTLDQDSVCSDASMVSKLSRKLTNGVGMATPFIVDRNKLSLEDYFRLALPATEFYRQPARRGAITSGALVDLAAWQKVGGFDELFFIDYVDYDFNQRLMDNGYSIIRVNDAPLLHEVGRAVPTWLRVPRKDLGGKWSVERFYSFGHSPFRCYYKARNRILFTRKHGRRLGLTHEGAWQIPQQIALTLFFESQRIPKLKSFIRGIRDGLRQPL